MLITPYVQSKFGNLLRAKNFNDLNQEEITDPLFMHIDKITELPMASNRPLKI